MSPERMPPEATAASDVTEQPYSSGDLRAVRLSEVEQAVYRFAETSTAKQNGHPGLATKVRAALDVIEEAIARYGIEGLALSFNGGKDCTVLLHLWTAAVVRFQRTAHAAPAVAEPPEGSGLELLQGARVPAIYVGAYDPFPEVNVFTEHCSRAFGVVLHHENGPMRAGLERFMAACPAVRAVLVGIRRTDPFAASLEAFQATDPGWPSFMRVHPILDWDYCDIWAYLHEFSVPYCSLYDQGYTSLGGVHNTRPNPALCIASDGGKSAYRPAWMLTDGSRERDGRS
ncbi:putative FAD synthetase [Thamnocephalis sphaerospora]|uniref:FAD synthase n=1 Tax=Thamnocephalis sphaerospora TaxID=78915 RepID=A0A4P9XUW2_9FUNG|nr:putative FAD synthetase [Thamnocephalis sphaerospora]|eukprot:RKP09371.1 putative FAD synthetase [Thamnocephalis sphaerospora]